MSWSLRLVILVHTKDYSTGTGTVLVGCRLYSYCVSLCLPDYAAIQMLTAGAGRRSQVQYLRTDTFTSTRTSTVRGRRYLYSYSSRYSYSTRTRTSSSFLLYCFLYSQTVATTVLVRYGTVY